mmetsp:Transcript_40878/g.46920  ORF Transcript_40878/g.46920 Transcript_40878/m.46920 type:complete len:214 (+) Transcript_40878:573-1214(+)
MRKINETSSKSNRASRYHLSETKKHFDKFPIELPTKQSFDLKTNTKGNLGSEVSHKNPLSDINLSIKTQSVHFSHDANRQDFDKFSSINSEKLKEFFCSHEDKIVMNPETIHENSEICNQEEFSHDETFSREIEVNFNNEEEPQEKIEFNMEEVKASYYTVEKQSQFVSITEPVLTNTENESKAQVADELYQSSPVASTKFQCKPQQYYTVAD